MSGQASAKAPAGAADTASGKAEGVTSPELQEMWKNATIASDYLKALANESRLLVLCLLAEKERSVSELEQFLAMRQPTVSQQLARLRLEGLVETRRDGKTVYYSLADENTRRFIKLIYETFCHR